MNVRRPMAAAIAVLGLPVMSLGLTACGFNVQTNEVYNPPVGVNEPFGFISTLNVAIVSDTDGAGTLITTFNNYDTQNDDELVDIFTGLGQRHHYDLTDDALERVRALISAEPRTRGFGNARFVRNLFETAVAHQAMRVAPLEDPSDEHLTTLTADDIAPVDS